MKVILNALFFDYDLKKAVLGPRLHNQLDPNATEAEPDFDKVSVTKTTLTYVSVWVDNPSHKSPANIKPFYLLTQEFLHYFYLQGCEEWRKIFQQFVVVTGYLWSV